MWLLAYSKHTGRPRPLQLERTIFLNVPTIANNERVVASRETALKQWISIMSSSDITSGWWRVVDTAVQLSERRKCSSTHPHNQVFILVTIVWCIMHIQLVDRAMPIDWCRSTNKSTWCIYAPHSVLLSASLYVSKRGAYWDRLCRDVVGWLSRACTVAKRCILGL